jgi:hypothetical protein
MMIIRRLYGLSQEEMARQLEQAPVEEGQSLDRFKLARIESGAQAPDPWMLDSFCISFGCRMQILLRSVPTTREILSELMAHTQPG